MQPHAVSRPSPRLSIRLIGVAAAHYLAIEGKGSLDGSGRAAEVLLDVAEAIRLRHAGAGRNFALGFPELLVWEGDRWEVLLRVPESVRPTELDAVRKDFHARRREASRAVELVRLEEGACLEGTMEGGSGPAISAALALRAGEMGMRVAEPRHEMRRPGGPLVVRQRLVMQNGMPPAERPDPRRRRPGAATIPWKRRL